MTSRPALGALCLSALVIAGCTSSHKDANPTPSAVPVHSGQVSGGAEAATPPPTGCKIATTAMVEAAFGAKVGAVTIGTTATGNSTCQFALASSNVGLPGSVLLTLDRTATAADFEAARVATGGEPVPDVGDRAFYVATQTTLQMLKARSSVTVQARLKIPAGVQPKPATVRADTISLARAVAKQL